MKWKRRPACLDNLVQRTASIVYIGKNHNTTQHIVTPHAQRSHECHKVCDTASASHHTLPYPTNTPTTEYSMQSKCTSNKKPFTDLPHQRIARDRTTHAGHPNKIISPEESLHTHTHIYIHTVGGELNERLSNNNFPPIRMSANRERRS